MKLKSVLTVIIVTISCLAYAQNTSIQGKVTSNGESLPYVNIMIKGTNLGVATDASGFYQMSGIPGGKRTIEIEAQAVGYKKEIKTIEVKQSGTQVNFDLEPDVLKLEQVVVTANRNEVKRKDAPVIVNTLGPEKLEALNTNNLSDGLNFVPGLRTENNCQNCGFTQLRMNGMEGAYAQILINGKAVFSGLAGVYGLEILPSGMIERIEIIRGGGSALYGSNAIAGSVNVITKEPTRNSYAVKLNQQFIGVGYKNTAPANDQMVNFNTSIISDNARNGMALYGFYKNRGHFDANNDSFSEVPEINNITIGGHFYQRIGMKSKLTTDLYAINARRRGGNKFDMPMHEADIAEAVDHQITAASLSFDHYMGKDDKLSLYLSGQKLDRDSYYGAEQALDAYGKTSDLTYIAGVQYNARVDKLNIVSGFENQGGILKDEKLGYRFWDDFSNSWLHLPNSTVADQMINTTGSFAQADYKLGKFITSFGLRYDHYVITDSHSETDDVSGDVLSPRINLLYNLSEIAQARLSYSQGYRAPQIFDEDLHIESSGARTVIHKNDDDLVQETSHSAIASLDFHPNLENNNLQILAEAFYTRLIDPFSNEYGIPDDNGKVIYTRINADGFAHVYGINLELNWIKNNVINFGSGFTFQRSEYSEEQEFGENSFLRTPDSYGYASLRINPAKNWKITLTENYTGSMLIPYFGTNLANQNDGELRTTNSFFDTGIKVCYHFPVEKLDLRLFAGIKNIFNSYQDDFDIGIMRDPGYMYGPILPRTVHFGIKLGSF